MIEGDCARALIGAGIDPATPLVFTRNGVPALRCCRGPPTRGEQPSRPRPLLSHLVADPRGQRRAMGQCPAPAARHAGGRPGGRGLP